VNLSGGITMRLGPCREGVIHLAELHLLGSVVLDTRAARPLSSATICAFRSAPYRPRLRLFLVAVVPSPSTTGQDRCRQTGPVQGGLAGRLPPAIVEVLMGVVTGVFGDGLCDIVCNEIPRASNEFRARQMR
jgi:hypothetical protein